MVKRISIAFLLVALLVSLIGIIPILPVLAAATTSLTITKYAQVGTTVLAQTTIDYQTMEASLPVQGDGVMHQYLQGPVFEGDIWDPDEMTNIKDWGANRGTDLKDICDLVGGMSPGDTVEVKANDGLSRTYDYPNVYTPDPRQGKMVICWWYNGQYVPAWSDGMRLVFFAETPNPDDIYVFGNWDQHECFPSSRWYFFNGEYPTTTGHSVKYINRINIYSNQAAEYDLTIAIDGEGSTSPGAGRHAYPSGTVVDIKATPADGWQFTNWTENVADPESATTKVTMDEDKTVIATFGQNQYRLNINVDGEGTTSPATGKHYYDSGTDINIEAFPEEGWNFVNWEGDVLDKYSERTRVTMDGNKTITAYFARVFYELTIIISGQGSTSPDTGKHRYSQDTVVSLQAVPQAGWVFAGWTGDIADTAILDTNITMNENKRITARFEQVTGQVAGVPLPPDEEVGQELLPSPPNVQVEQQLSPSPPTVEVGQELLPPSPDEKTNRELLPPSNKSGTLNWMIILGIICGVGLLTSIAFFIFNFYRR